MKPYYHCQRCTACCRLPGFVRLLPQELEPIADYLGISVEQFTSDYCDLLPSRTGLTLVSRSDNSCIFLEGNSCKIHPVKPLQCRGFPNTWNFPGWRNICKAIPVKIEPSET